MAYPISDVARRIIYSGSAGVGPYSFAFEVLEQTDVAVYKNTTLLTLTTDYTVTINVDGTGSITLVSPAVAADDITLIGARAIERTSDFVTGGDLFANTLNDELDSQTIFAQQQQDEINRSMKMAPWTNTAFNTQLPDPQPNKFLAFNATADGFQSASGSELANLVAYANAFADTFVGDGSTTSWTLTRTPASLLNLDVSIDGVTQVPTTNYTVSGTTFTMTSAPPSGSVILVRYAEVLADSNGDSANVRYTPAGTGAVDTTVQAKLRETVSVRDFGAVGDGVTDDTNAILAAIAAMPSSGGALFFPAATYIVNSDNVNGLKFNGKSNFVVEGYGATIKVEDGAAVITNHEVMFFINCQNGAINGLTIDGNRANRSPFESASHCLSITDYCSQITVNDVICKNSTTDCIYISTTVLGTQASYPTDITLVNCVADNAFRNGLSAIGSLRLTVQGGEYKNTNGALPKCGIDVEPDAGYTFGNRFMVVDGARLFNNDGYGLTLGGPIGLNQNILITNVTGSNNDLGFLNIASCDNPTLRNVVAYDHPVSDRGIIDVGTQITNPIIDGADFIGITASGVNNVCIYLHGSITGVPTVRNINVEAASCPILYCGIKADIDSIYGNFVPDVAILLEQNYSSLKNVQLSNCSDRSIYVSGSNVTLDGIHLVDCGQANSRAIQFEAANAIVRNVDILFTGARPANFIGILFNSGVPRFISNVLAKAASSDFNNQSVMSFTSGVAGSTIRNVSPSPFGVSQVWDPGSIANGASESLAVSVPGVVFGMVCYASLGISTQGMTLTATVSAADTITATLANNTGGAIDLASSTLNVFAEGF
jgi:hypothetical protein